MDYIREFDIKLDKEYYYAGETINGTVILDTLENFKLRCVRVILRGKVHAEWRVIVSGDRRTVRDDEYLVDERTVVWGTAGVEGAVPVLPRGTHRLPFRFTLPETALPCSFESKPCCVRYYVKVTVDIPYASPPQGMKYFTVIGPHIDCMDEQYLRPVVGLARSRRWWCWWWRRPSLTLHCTLERSAYVCRESLRLRATVDNRGAVAARLHVRLHQHCLYQVGGGASRRARAGAAPLAAREVQRVVLEYQGDAVKPGTREHWDSAQSLVVPVLPTTLLGICRLLRIYYVLKVSVDTERRRDAVRVYFPITVATVPFRVPNKEPPPVVYETASGHVEGGLYIGPEFLLGQVYDGMEGTHARDPIVLYRPVYVTVSKDAPTDAQQAAQTAKHC